MTQSLMGKNVLNCNNLFGKNDFSQKGVPLEIRNLKIQIITNIILPLISKQWGQLYENMFFLENMKLKLDRYYQLYKMEDLLLYKDIIRAFENVLTEHTQLTDLEKKIHTNKGDEFTSIVYKTTMIRLKPEYELYDAIFGKPKRDKNQVYNDETVQLIRHLLNQEKITFKKIKEQVLSYMDNFQ
jgi:hypothetical protein